MHGLDIAYYLSLPSFAYDCFLRERRVKLDPIIDQELYTLLRENLRGGFVTSVTQITRVSPPPPGAGKEHIMYVVFNSLYSQ